MYIDAETKEDCLEIEEYTENVLRIIIYGPVPIGNESVWDPVASIFVISRKALYDFLDL